MGRHTTKLGGSSRAETRPPLPYPVQDGRVAPPVQAAMDRRTQRRKSRLAALSAATMLAIGGAAGMSMAMADEPEAAQDGEIVFSGDCGALGLLSATSNPDSAEVTVTEGSQVSYSNDLGADAKLHVGGETYDIGEGATQVFVMNQSAEVAMVPQCHGLFAEYQSAQVNVVAAQHDADESKDAEPDTGELPSRGSDSDGSSDSSTDAETDAGVSDSASGSAGTGSREGGTALRGDETEGADGAETGDEPERPDESEEEEVNSFGPSAGDEDTGATELTSTSDEVVAVDPKAVSNGASGLLALVAIVCLVGVSAAVMRTLLKQRATA